MTSNTKHNLVLGALTADTASLGLHWIYDQERIKNVAAKTPEFHQHTQSDYDGVMSFFAHGKKSVGDLSHYGEQAFVLLTALANNLGEYDVTQYQDSFRNHFSYGGDYVGYIDRPTKDTLDNIILSERSAFEKANALPFNNTNDVKQNIINLVLKQLKDNINITPKDLKEITASELCIKLDTDYLQQLIDSLKPISNYHGADDVQLPAISKLPALVAIYAGQAELAAVTESSVRITNNNDIAVSYAQVASKMMESAITTQNIDKVIEAGKQAATPEILNLIKQALDATDKTTPEFTQHIGMSCNLELGIPTVFHILNQHLSYQDSIRQNIFAGGDSCGRSILLGAVLGAAHGIEGEKGIPNTWLEKLNQREHVNQLLNAVL